MARQYSRSDYITDLASHNARHDHEREHARPRGPPIPDLRFEPTYMRKVGQHVRIERTEGGLEVVHVEWGKVLWLTTKDQVLAPLLQGLVWGVAGVMLRPAMTSLLASFRRMIMPHPRIRKGGFTACVTHSSLYP
ncbi:unnamed protein product [Peniophora sp. CBMAI 1063]|nr:unnamed protein product [Peniophora sp. CBMAI 1063]